MEIFVGNLSFGTIEDDIRQLFNAFGTVERVNVITDRETGRPPTFTRSTARVNCSLPLTSRTESIPSSLQPWRTDADADQGAIGNALRQPTRYPLAQAEAAFRRPSP